MLERPVDKLVLIVRGYEVVNEKDAGSFLVEEPSRKDN